MKPLESFANSISGTYVAFRDVVVRDGNAFNSKLFAVMFSIILLLIGVMAYWIKCPSPLLYTVFRILLVLALAVIVVQVFVQLKVGLRLLVFLVVAVGGYRLVPSLTFLSTPCTVKSERFAHPLIFTQLQGLIDEKITQCEASIKRELPVGKNIKIEQLRTEHNSFEAKGSKMRYRNFYAFDNGEIKLSGKKNLKKESVPLSFCKLNQYHNPVDGNWFIIQSSSTGAFNRLEYRYEDRRPFSYSITGIDTLGEDTLEVVIHTMNGIRHLLTSYTLDEEFIKRQFNYFGFRSNEVFWVYWNEGWNVKFKS